MPLLFPAEKFLSQFLNWFPGSTKWVKIVKLADNSVVNWTAKVVNGVVDFGSYNSRKFRKQVGLLVGDGTQQAHHIVSRNLRNHRVIQKAARSEEAFHIDELLNDIPVETWRNQFNHFTYDNKVEKLLNDIPDSLSPEDTYNEVADIIESLKEIIKANPGKHLNELNF